MELNKKLNTSLLIVFVAVVSSVSTNLMDNLFLADAHAETTQPAKQVGHHFSECFSTNMWVTTGRRVNDGELPKKTVKIPTGWTVVGGSGAVAGEPTMILCK